MKDTTATSIGAKLGFKPDDEPIVVPAHATPVDVPSGAICFTWTEALVVDEDGYEIIDGVRVSDDEKREDCIAESRRREREVAEAQRAGDPQHEAWSREQVQQESANAARFAHREIRTRSGAGGTAKQRRPDHARRRAGGSGRPKAQATRSSARSGDSGTDSEASEPPPERLCGCGCGLALVGLRSHARYLNDAHRKRAQRDRDRLEPERPTERRLVLLAQNGALASIRCRCNPKHELVDGNVCVQCGRPRGAPAVTWLAEAGDLRSKQLVARAPARRNPRYGDRKRKPVTERKVAA